MQFFMKCLKLAFMYKTYDTLRYMMFLLKILDTSQKSRQFALRFYMQKSGNFALRDFHETFEIIQGEGGISIFKNAICITFL